MFSHYKRREAENNFKIGESHFKEYRYSNCIEYFERSKSIYEDIDDKVWIAICERKLGFAFLNSSNFDKAISAYKNSLIISRIINDKKGEASTLCYIGQVHRHNGNFKEAIEYQEKGLSISKNINDFEGEMKTYFDLGNIYFQIGNINNSLKAFSDGLDIANSLKDESEIGIFQASLGQVFFHTGLFVKASESFIESLNIAKKNNDTVGIVISSMGLGQSKISIGNYDEAIEILESIIKLAKEIGNRKFLIDLLSNIGLCYNRKGELNEALNFSLSALEEVEKDKSSFFDDKRLSVYGELGNIYQNLNNIEAATNYFKKQLDLANNREEVRFKVNANGSLGDIYFQSGDFSTAWEYLEKALSYFKESLELLGENEEMKIWFAEQGRFLYRTAVLNLHRSKDIEGALRIAEEDRSRLLNRKLNSIEEIPFDIEKVKKYSKENNTYLIEYYVNHEITIDKKGNSYPVIKEFIFWIITPNGEVQSDIIPCIELWNELPHNRLSKKGINFNFIFSLPKANSLVNTELDKDDFFEVEQMLKRFYAYFFKPINKYINKEEVENIIIIPHYELFLLPFHSLINEQEKYLIEEFNITYSPSLLSILIWTEKEKGKKIKILSEPKVVGNPDMPLDINDYSNEPKKLSNLEGAKNEAKKIAKLLKINPILGKDATKQRILAEMKECSLIHLATHTVFENSKSIDTHLAGLIAFAPEFDDKGYLSCNEILQLNLSDIKLVVLAVCDSGKGVPSSEGITGLTWAFLNAGVESIIVSQWKADDIASRFIFVNFYKELLKDEIPAMALKKAMLTTKKKYPQLPDWAPYILFGRSVNR